MTCHKPMLESLKQQGLRVTAQRALILEDLFHNPGHRTAEDVYKNVSERLPGLNRATVYRTLEMLHEASVVLTFPGPEGITEFELVRSVEELHHHLVCRKCGAEYALGNEPVEALRSAILNRFGFHADLDHIVVSGLSATCAAASGQGD